MNQKKEQITNEKVVIIDQSNKRRRILKHIEIHTKDGKIRKYVLWKTSKGKYLLN